MATGTNFGLVLTIAVALIQAAPYNGPLPVEVAFDELSSFLEADIMQDKVTTKMAMKDNHRLWPGGVMRYVIGFDSSNHVNTYNNFLQAVDRINDVGCVILQLGSAGTDTDLVNITMADEMASNRGRQGGVQTLSITDGAVLGVIMHELMHTLGFGHEHNRPDRDEYVTVYMDNIQEDAKPYFNKYTAKSGYVADVAEYDYMSLMHATRIHSPDINIDISKPVIERKDGGTAMGQRDGLSEHDKERLRLTYSCGMCSTSGNNNHKLLRYPGDCKMFYQCVHDSTMPRHCSKGLHFNKDLSVCDYPEIAGCTSMNLNVKPLAIAP